MNKYKIIILIAVFALGVFAGVLISVSSFPEEKSVSGPVLLESESTFSLMLDFGEGNIETFHDIKFKSGEKLFSALEKVLADNKIKFEFQDYKDLGKLVSRIGDKKNGEGEKYWQYWVNNRHADVGVDQYALKPNDAVEWKFIKFKGE